MEEIWSDEFVCPACGEDLEEWHENIYKCNNCENILNIDTLQEVEVGSDGL